MKITDVQACVIGRSEPHSGGSVWTFVRLYTDQGITGTGECNSAAALYTGFAVKEAVLAFKPMLVGADPTNIAPLVERVRRRGRYGGGSQAPVAFALSGIDMALYDLVGKARGVPAYQLLGGAFRKQIRLYADCHHGASAEPESFAEKAQEVVAEGYGTVKFDVDGTGAGTRDAYNWTADAAELDHMVRIVEAVRQAVGPEVDVAIDCHGGFDVPTAIALARAVEPLRLLWLEEPVPPENLEACAQIQRATSTPIATGENAYLRFEFAHLLAAEAARIITPDLAKAGGIGEGARIGWLADTHYVPMAPHNVSSPLGMMAACHTCAAVPNFLVLEFHARGISWWQDLCDGDHPFIEDGHMTVSEAPGIGVELNPAAAKKLLWNGDTYFSEP